MYLSYSLQGDEPMLTDDDIAGICAAYPSDRPKTACKPEPQRGYAADCGGNVEGSCALNARGARFGTMAAVTLIAAGILLARRRAKLTRARLD
jgi:hypothetical protein